MPNPRSLVVVFVHGWSVTHTNTYGELPERLRREAQARGIDLVVREIFLGRYVSFHDEVRVEDISRAFRTAVKDQLDRLIEQHGRFVCITHSTGGPVIRDWWHRYYETKPKSGSCPMSHLVMLAPANHGSTLAQLGKGRLGRIKAWGSGVEPGQGVLDWLELGSPESFELNSAWITSDGSQIGPQGVFPFVLTGQAIDRKLYDNLNAYTGEAGSDGVVRVAAANLNATYVRLSQETPRPKRGRRGQFEAPLLQHGRPHTAPNTAMRVVSRKSHSGTSMGIMRSVKAGVGRAKDADTVDAIMQCLEVRTRAQYQRLCERFAAASARIQEAELAEVDRRRFLTDTWFFNDRHCMVIFRVRDHEGFPVEDFDLVLTAGDRDDPNHLPRGFLADRQRNSRDRGTLTYYFNYDAMVGSPAYLDGGTEVRAARRGTGALGLRVAPRPTRGFVRYLPCRIKASRALLTHVIKPNQTTLVDIVLRRVVGKNVFRLDRGTRAAPFKAIPPGEPLAD